jgi:hypothetical protein
MIAFATLFLGLVVGIQPVEIVTRGNVSAVEILFDGKPAARLDAAPWRTSVDFGRDLAPHELVARGLDAKGREVARARQWLNLPRPPAELQILLQRDEHGSARGAQLAWESLTAAPPTSVRVTFDGRPLDVRGREAFEVPAYDATTSHLLSANVEFDNGIHCRADSVLGGRSSSEAASELTGVPIRIAADRALPPASALEGALLRRGAALRPVAVERAPAQLLIVRDVSEREALARLGRGGKTTFEQRRGSVGGSLPQYDSEASKLEMRLGDEDRIRMIWPVVQKTPTTSGLAELFETSHDFTGKTAGLFWLVTRVSRPGKLENERRFADAVAVAGLQALQSCTRRAVILLLGKETADASRLAPENVRGYLERIRVPLFVWTLDPKKPPSSGWGHAEDVSTLPKLRTAVERVRAELESQAIVWVEGQQLPQEIEISGSSSGVELVGKS